MDWKQTEKEIKELIAWQEEKLLKAAKRIEPQVTLDDLWQPNDFPELENHPLFRYEEGVLHGIRVLEAALRRLHQSCRSTRQAEP